MHADKIISRILILIFFVMIFAFIAWDIKEEARYEYECIDYQGNKIYCEKVYQGNNGTTGLMSDGTHIKITSYKKILKESDKNERYKI